MNSINQGLLHRLGRAFLFQAALISVLAALSVFVAGFVLEEIMIKQALRDEASHFWASLDANPDFAPPATLNLTGYLTDTEPAPPEAIRQLSAGFHRVKLHSDDASQVYVANHSDKQLYLVFNADRVRDLSFYFGLVPLAGILIVLYLGAWLAYRMSRQAISPIIWLAAEVNQLDPTAPDVSRLAPERVPGEGHSEISVLANAITDFAERLNAFVDRERNFTRDASHELRSPLTVIKMATELLESQPLETPQAAQSLERIKRCTREMEELVAMFLLLARDSDRQISTRGVCINTIVDDELLTAQLLVNDKSIAIRRDDHYRLVTAAPEKVLSVLVANLLRNAFSYTDAGSVEITIGRDRLTIEDSGVGISEQAVKDIFRPYFRGDQRQRGGHGVGLTIVKRLSDRFNWPVEIDSRPGIGTRVVVRFPHARAEQLRSA